MRDGWVLFSEAEESTTRLLLFSIFIANKYMIIQLVGRSARTKKASKAIIVAVAHATSDMPWWRGDVLW